VPRDLETIVAACMEKRPERRYRSAQALADDLSRFLRGEPVSRRAAGPLERAQRFVGRHKRAVLLASLALAVGAVLLARSGSRAPSRPRARRRARRPARRRRDP
jgi:serine/threonine-protein kinase